MPESVDTKEIIAILERGVMVIRPREQLTLTQFNAWTAERQKLVEDMQALLKRLETT